MVQAELKKVLHLVGSQTSHYYFGVSAHMYAPGCIAALSELEHVVLLAHLDGTWSVCKELDEDTVSAAAHLTLPEALVKLQVEEPDISVMQPHMYDYKGMTSCRSIADILQIPMVGSPGEVMALTTNKWQSRAVVESYGVPVPRAQLLNLGDEVKMPVPFMIKPCREDNSMGITLVQREEDIPKALQDGFAFDNQLLCEQFIPLGREFRVGVVDSATGSSDELEFLPVMEYFLGHKELPIRTSADKITASQDGKDVTFAPVERKIPADEIDDVLMEKLQDLAKKSHVALACEQYSLYDVRVDPEGNPFFIEASPYCSFSPASAMVTMARGDPKYNDTDLFYRLALKAVAQHEACKQAAKDGNTQTLGMRKVQHPASKKESNTVASS